MSLTIDYAHPSGTPALTLYSFIERVADGLYWDTSDHTFKAKGSISGSNGKVSLTEDADEPGRYLATVATSYPTQFTDGNYKCIIRNNSGDTLLGIHQKYMKDQAEIKFRINEL